MSDGLVLLGVLGAFYLQDCSLWLDRGATVFTTWSARRWRPVRPHAVLTGNSKGLVLSFRLPPLAPLFMCPPWHPTDTAPMSASVRFGMGLPAFRAELARFSDGAFVLRCLCNALFVYFFVVVPTAMIFWSLSALWPVLLSGLATLSLPAAFEFHDLHAWLWPTESSARRSELLHMALYPPAAIRAHGHLALRIAAPYHPIVVAAALCVPSDFTAFAGQYLRELRYPLLGDPAPNIELHAAEARAVAAFLATLGVDPDSLLRPPVTADPDCLSWCPRCHAPYAISHGTCADCCGVALIPHPRDAVSGSAPETPQVHSP